MKSICSCPSCDNPERTRRVQVLGKELLLKNYICSEDGIHYRPKPEQIKLQLTICPTDYCAAACPFCIATNTGSRARLDLRKLEKALQLLKQENVVRGVSFSGGEPFTDVGLLNDALTLVFEILGLDTEVSITTNGTNLHQLHRITYLPRVDALHISRHHYEDEANRSIFGIDVPTAARLKEIVHSVSYRDLFVLNCMLLKDHIGTVDQVHRFLDFAIETGVGKVSFITGTPVNDYVRQQRLSYTQVLKPGDPSLLFTRGYRDYEFCQCQDGVYVSPKGELMEFYGRYSDPSDCGYCRGFVYGADNCLRTGYGGQIILGDP